METTNFITNEIKHKSSSALTDTIRLFKSLPIMRILLPICIIINFLAATFPAIFRWYMAKLVDCNQNQCVAINTALISFQIPISVEFFIFITLFAALLRVMSWILFEVPGQLSTTHVHQKMVKALFATRTTYFDENPSGRILNRLVSDFDYIRYEIIIWSGDCLNASLEILLSALLLCFISPWLLLLTIFLFVIFYYLQLFSSQILQLIRQESSIARGRLLNKQNALIEGAEIYSLYNKLHTINFKLNKELSNFAQASLLFGRIDGWCNFWINITGEIYSFIILIFLIFSIHNRLIDIAIAGTIISALFGISSTLGWLNFAAMNLNSSLVHAKRVFEIIDLPKENDEERSSIYQQHVKTKSLHENYSTNFLQPISHPLPITFCNYSMAYRKNSPLILNNLTLEFPAGKKIALTGRTGKGKTSIMQALMRMVYVHQGDILLGNTSIFNFNLHEYRKLYGIIPQYPWLFSGILRENLARNKDISDEILLEYLDLAGLNFKLTDKVNEGGLNFSPGERQLLAMVRVLAMNKQYLFLDEPTSSIDRVTDAKITKLLNSSCKGKTLIIIAHREETIKDAEVTINLDNS